MLQAAMPADQLDRNQRIWDATLLHLALSSPASIEQQPSTPR
jgi:hypothetical protein